MGQALALESVDPSPDTSRVESQKKILGHREPYNGMGVLGLPLNNEGGSEYGAVRV